MPRVFRPTYTRAIPPAAEHCTHRDRPAVRWRGRGGKWVYGVVCDSNPGRCLVESSRHRVSYTAHDGRPASARGYADRQASDHLMAELVTRSARIHAGQLPVSAAAPRLSLTELLDKWRRYMAHNGAKPESAATLHQRARDVCRGVGAVRPADLTPAAVLDWLAERRKGPRFGARTAAEYLSAAKSFTRWCAAVEKAEPVDHLSAVRRRRAESEATYKRRALPPADLSKLLAATRRSELVVYGLTGRERHALYVTACSTGLRAAELASLSPASFDLVRSEVTIEGRRAKNRRTETLPLTADVVRAVKPLLSGRGPVWPNRGARTSAWWRYGARMIRRDLAAAGVPYAVDGRVFDFHSLRGQFITDLDRAGVSLVRAQKLARHSDPKLTARHYTKPEREELAAEVAKLRRGGRR